MGQTSVPKRKRRTIWGWALGFMYSREPFALSSASFFVPYHLPVYLAVSTRATFVRTSGISKSRGNNTNSLITTFSLCLFPLGFLPFVRLRRFLEINEKKGNTFENMYRVFIYSLFHAPSFVSLRRFFLSLFPVPEKFY